MSKCKFDPAMICGRFMAALLLSTLVAGCGGSGESSSNGAGPGSTTTVSGIAASGKPINGGTVQMVCANSNTSGTAVITGADGAFTVSAAPNAPCVIRVSGGDIVGGPLFSVVTSTAQTRANVNQLTTMLAFLLAGGNPDTGLFQSPSLISSKITPTAVATFKEMIRASTVANLGVAAGIPPDFDFLESAFTANHLGFDLLLDKLGLIPGSTVSITFNGAALLAVNPATGVASTTSSAVIGDAALAAAGLSGAFIEVTAANMQGWSFINDCGVGTPAGALVTGPATPPLGMGSAQLSLGADPRECMMLATPAYVGTTLSHLTLMNYSSYQSGPTLAIALQFDVRFHPDDAAFQGRLVFEPYQNGTVTVGSGWQNWSALDGNWWASKTTAVGSNGLCPQSSPCTWNQIMINWPNASIRGNTLFKAGSGWPSFAGNLDAFTIGIHGSNTTYDFE